MKGGPTKKPVYAAVVTAARARPVGGHVPGASRGAEGRWKDYGEACAGAGEAGERDDELGHSQGDTEANGSGGRARADQPGGTYELREPVAEEASKGHGQ